MVNGVGLVPHLHDAVSQHERPFAAAAQGKHSGVGAFNHCRLVARSSPSVSAGRASDISNPETRVTAVITSSIIDSTAFLALIDALHACSLDGDHIVATDHRNNRIEGDQRRIAPLSGTFFELGHPIGGLRVEC